MSYAGAATAMEALSNREISIIIWSSAFVVWCFWNKDVRPSMLQLFKTALHRYIVAAVVYVSFCVLLVVWSLYSAGIWRFDQAKDTALWFGFVALVAFFRSASREKALEVFRNWIADNLKIVVVIEFIVSRHSFSLIGEIFLVPILVFLGGAIAVAGMKKEHASVGRLLNGILIVIGSTMVGRAAWGIFSDIGGFATFKTAIEFITPFLMSILLLPFLYAFIVYLTYETILVRLRFQAKSDECLYRYMKWQAIRNFGPDLEFLQRWSRAISAYSPRNASEVDNVTAEIKALKAREFCPPTVQYENGWSPYEAKDFLADIGLSTGDYRTIGEEWFATSVHLEIEDELSLNYLKYRVSGNAIAVVSMELELCVWYPKTSDLAEEKFSAATRILLNRIFSSKVREMGTLEFSLTENGAEIEILQRKLSLKREVWRHDKLGEQYSKKLVIRCEE